MRFAPLPLVLLLTGVAAAAPPEGGLKLQRGDEFLYVGTSTESVDRPTVRLRRTYELRVRVFVLERRENWADAAVLALVRRTDDSPVSEALQDVTGEKLDERSPAAARLDLVRIHADGTVHLIAPLGPSPLRLAADTPLRLLPTPPLDSSAPFEFGPFAPRARAADPAWAAVGHDFVHSERCLHLRRVEHAADWEYPRGGQVSWYRSDEAWMSTDGMARKFKRSIRQRDGIATEPAVKIDVALELREQGRPIGRMYDRYRADIEAAYLAATELGPLMKDAARHGPEPFKQRIQRLDAHLEVNAPGSPYREAVLAVKRQIEAARRGEAISLPTSATVEAMPRTVALGRFAPEIASGDFKLTASRGTPVVLVFFMPGQETAKPSLVIADALQKKFGPRIRVAALSVFAPLAEGNTERDRLKLSVPVYDGSAAETAYGIESFPRFFIIDSSGTLKWSQAGVGNETGFQVREQVEGLLGLPAATGSPTGPTAVRPTAKP